MCVCVWVCVCVCVCVCVKCTYMVKVVTAADMKTSNTPNSSLEGAIYEAHTYAILLLLRCSFRWYPFLKTFFVLHLL